MSDNVEKRFETDMYIYIVRITTSLFVIWSVGYQFERQVQYGQLCSDTV